jgi:hypothetical protein
MTGKIVKNFHNSYLAHVVQDDAFKRQNVVSSHKSHGLQKRKDSIPKVDSHSQIKTGHGYDTTDNFFHTPKKELNMASDEITFLSNLQCHQINSRNYEKNNRTSKDRTQGAFNPYQLSKYDIQSYTNALN